MNDVNHLLEQIKLEIKLGKREKGYLDIKTLISLVKLLPKDTLVVPKLSRPDSYRGYYEDLAFEYSNDFQTAAELLELLESCIGKTYTGYKGGDYTCHENTLCWFGFYGTTCGSKAITGLEYHEDAGTAQIVAVEDDYT
jgi:hypothetical protein